jgi:hypothetical protein
MYFSVGQDAIEDGTKTMTRRRLGGWGLHYTNTMKERMKAGVWIRANSGRAAISQFGWVKLTKMYQQRFGDMPLEDVSREGYPVWSLLEFKQLKCFAECDDDTVMWVVEFIFMDKLIKH